MHLFSLMAPQQPKKVTMMTMTLTTIKMMAAVEYTVMDTLKIDVQKKLTLRV